ncbi:MAG: phosphate/phosphite/phosphonate ABC transporter substrate-binding protein [Bacillota bacterium]
MIILVLLAIGAGAGIYVAWNWNKAGNPTPVTTRTTQPATRSVIRLGLVPEHDPFVLRQSYRGLQDYLSQRLGQPVELATLNTYEAVLLDFQEHQIEGAFLGSLVGLLAIDRFDARVIVKPELEDRVSTYRGVIFTRENSSIQSLDDLRGKPLAMLRATTAGSLFPIAELAKRGMLEGAMPVKIIWMGTHDQVIAAVMSGRAEAGAVKDLRLNAFLQANPQTRVRQLAISKPVPNNALVMRADVANGLGTRLAELLKAMDQDPQGQAALQMLGARRFIPCQPEEFNPISEMAASLGSAWKWVGVNGEPPKRAQTPVGQ